MLFHHDGSNMQQQRSSTVPSPFDLFFDQLHAAQAAANSKGHLMIRGVPEDEDEDEDEDEERDNTKYTQEDMANIRVVFATPQRIELMDKMEQMILGDQYGDGMLMFNTSFSYGVFASIEHVSAMCKSTQAWSSRFDTLFGYTFTLHKYDVWVHDNEGMDLDFLSTLAALWSSVLVKTDTELGVVDPYTRQGVLCLLGQFKELLNDAPEGPFDFDVEGAA